MKGTLTMARPVVRSSPQVVSGSSQRQTRNQRSQAAIESSEVAVGGSQGVGSEAAALHVTRPCCHLTVGSKTACGGDIKTCGLTAAELIILDSQKFLCKSWCFHGHPHAQG